MVIAGNIETEYFEVKISDNDCTKCGATMMMMTTTRMMRMMEKMTTMMRKMITTMTMIDEETVEQLQTLVSRDF